MKARLTILAGVVFLVGICVLHAQGPMPSPLAYTPPPAEAPQPSPFIAPGPNDWTPSLDDGCMPGWFFDAEVALLFPNLNFGITNLQPLFNGQQIHVPDVDLPLSVSPTFELGYRLPNGQGLFALSYRFLTTEGKDPVAIRGIPFDVRTRVNTNVINLDYGTTPYEFAPRYVLSTRLGAQIASVFFDSQASNSIHLEQASNSFFGAGPHGRLDLERRIVMIPGLTVFGRADGAVLIGRVKQRFRTEDAVPGGTFVQTVAQREQQAVPTINLQAGVSFAPPSLPGVKFTTGYVFEQYWSVGDVDNSPSNGELWSHGWFLRGQIDF